MSRSAIKPMPRLVSALAPLPNEKEAIQRTIPTLRNKSEDLNDWCRRRWRADNDHCTGGGNNLDGLCRCNRWCRRDRGRATHDDLLTNLQNVIAGLNVIELAQLIKGYTVSIGNASQRVARYNDMNNAAIRLYTILLLHEGCVGCRWGYGCASATRARRLATGCDSSSTLLCHTQRPIVEIHPIDEHTHRLRREHEECNRRVAIHRACRQLSPDIERRYIR